MIDLILYAPDKPTLVAFAEAHPANNPLIETVIDPDDGTTIRRKREGFDYCWWAGSGDFKTANEIERATTTIDQVNATECAIFIGSSPPVWVENSLILRRDNIQIAYFDRIQGNYAVFTIDGYDGDGDPNTPDIPFIVNVGDTVTAFTPAKFLDGLVAILRIYGNFFNSNVINSDDPDYDDSEQWGRNRIAQYIKNNGVSGTMGQWSYYELDGVRLFKPSTVEDFLTANNLPGHEWFGGNSY